MVVILFVPLNDRYSNGGYFNFAAITIEMMP